MLHQFVTANRTEIIRRCRAKVAKRTVPLPTEAEMNHGVPLFLDQLVGALKLGESSNPEVRRTALLHGHDLLEQGFSVSQVVHDYGDVCQSITELAVEMNAPIEAEDFRILNACLDDAIAVAVTQFGRERLEASELERERLAFFAHEMRNLIHTAMIAFEVVKSGSVGVSGSTGNVLQRSLVRARDLISASLAEVRLSHGIQHREKIVVAEFIDDLVAAAKLTANATAVTFVTKPVDHDLVIDVDRQVMSAVLTNVLQNAFKFTRPRSLVELRVAAGDGRIKIEVQDGCGGLPGGDVVGIFRSFEQRGVDRTGLGLGLSFSRWGVESNGGRITARDLPGSGCIFTIDLPQAALTSSGPAGAHSHA
jgi:signal transduction histidine kinase